MDIPGISENWKQPIRVMVIVAILIIAYWFTLLMIYGSDKMIYQDFLNHKAFQMEGMPNCCSWWPITHFIFFGILAFIYPNDWLTIFIAGVLWEVVEISAGKIVQGVGWVPTAFRNAYNEVEYSKNWWAGSGKDIFFNTAGIIVGKSIRYIYDQRNNKE